MRIDITGNNYILMSRARYLYIYLVLLSNIFAIIPFGYLLDIGRGFPFLVIQLFWLLLGYTNVVKSGPLPGLNTFRYKKIVLYIYISVVPSIFMAKEYFDQSFLQSLISYRNLLLFLAIPTFLTIRPTIYDIMRSLYWYAWTFLIVSLLRTFLPFQFYTLSEREIDGVNAIMSKDSSDFLFYYSYSCISSLVIPLYYYCVRLWKKYDKKDAFKVLLIYFILVIVQNRSTLFPATIVVGITLLKCRIKPVYIKPILIVISSIVIIYFSGNIIYNLVEQTDREMGSSYDPRILAMDYFLDFDRLSILEILFGTGNISFQTSDYVQNLQQDHIHYSDVGFVGFWSQYGILPIIIFSYYLIKCLLVKKMPTYLKLVSIHILICTVTISYFDMPIHMIWFILFYYILCRYILEFHYRQV